MQLQAIWAHFMGAAGVVDIVPPQKEPRSGPSRGTIRSARIVLANPGLSMLFNAGAAPEGAPFIARPLRDGWEGLYRLDFSRLRACSRLLWVNFAPESIRAISCVRSLSSIRRTLVRVRPPFSAFSITKC